VGVPVILCDHDSFDIAQSREKGAKTSARGTQSDNKHIRMNDLFCFRHAGIHFEIKNSLNSEKRGQNFKDIGFTFIRFGSEGYQYIVYLDMKSAYDLPPPARFIEMCAARQVPTDVQQMLWSLLTTGACCSLIVNGKVLESFERHLGFPQGAPLSPICFNFFIDPLVEDLNCKSGKALFFADDGALLAYNNHLMNRLMDVAVTWARRNAMQWNINKCYLVSDSEADVTIVTKDLSAFINRMAAANGQTRTAAQGSLTQNSTS